MNTPKKIPPVEILGAINPTVDSAQERVLKYDLLTARAGKHAVYETVRLKRFFDSEDNSLEETANAGQLALQYFLMTASKLNEATTEASKRVWSERFTQASSELYGQPEVELSRALGTDSVNSLVRRGRDEHANKLLVDDFSRLANQYGLVGQDEHEFEVGSIETAQIVGKYFKENYQDVFSVLGFELEAEAIAPGYFALKTEEALAILAQNHDEKWSGWTVERREQSDKLSVSASGEKIHVGMLRVDMKPLEAMGLFAHEVLIHGQRGLNGKKISPDLGKGLSGYLDSEEGLGVLAEYAITGTIPEKNVDRYVDIALALGLTDGVPKTRQELLDFATMRARLRNEIAPRESKVDMQVITKSVHTHVNRIYRGSLGNEFVGVFTKDMAYQKGFMSMLAYVENSLAAGRSIEDVMKYLLQGKFDPLNELHVRVIEELGGEK